MPPRTKLLISTAAGALLVAGAGTAIAMAPAQDTYHAPKAAAVVKTVPQASTDAKLAAAQQTVAAQQAELKQATAKLAQAQHHALEAAIAGKHALLRAQSSQAALRSALKEIKALKAQLATAKSKPATVRYVTVTAARTDDPRTTNKHCNGRHAGFGSGPGHKWHHHDGWGHR